MEGSFGVSGPDTGGEEKILGSSVELTKMSRADDQQLKLKLNLLIIGSTLIFF